MRRDKVKHRINIQDIQLSYNIVGKGKPVIIIHGYAIDYVAMYNCLEPIFENIQGYKRIYIDLPGMGESQSASWIDNSDTILDIVKEFIYAVIPNEKFLMIGFSYGGYLALGIVNKIPELVDGMVLMSPVTVADAKKRDIPERTVLQRDQWLMDKLSEEMKQSLNAMMVIQTEETYKRYNDEIVKSIVKSDHVFLERILKTGYGFSFNIEVQYEKPVLILLGKQDSCVGYKDAWRLLDYYPRATFAVLDKAGHNLQIEQVEMFNSLMSEWVQRVEDEDA